MQYPTIPAGAVSESLDALLDGVIEDMSDHVVMFGSGEAVGTAALDDAVSDIRAALDARLAQSKPELDDDQFEGAMAARLHQGLSDHPIAALDDPSFWAYLATGPMWFFVKWREDPAKRKREGYQDYLDGRVNHACVPLRMYLRARAIANGDDVSLASAIEKGTDFWRSHIIRVRTGATPSLARAVTEQQRDDRMTVDPLREYAKRINRRWSNQVIHVLDEGESRALAESERSE